MSEEEFTCESCGGVFTKNRDGWSEEQALAERDALWTEEELGRTGQAVVCDDCFEMFMAWIAEHPEVREVKG